MIFSETATGNGAEIVTGIYIGGVFSMRAPRALDVE